MTNEIHPLTAFRLNASPPMTRAALASLLEVNRSTVARWENGDRQIDADLLPKISERTGIPAKELRADWAALLEAVE